MQNLIGSVVQLVERWSPKPKVEGSIPSWPAIKGVILMKKPSRKIRRWLRAVGKKRGPKIRNLIRPKRKS